MRIAIINLLFILLPIVLISIFIGIYVYKDATRREMNAALWTIVAVFAPSLIGLIIYFLVRGNYSDLSCPNCAEPVTSEFVVCPKCGAKLKNTCPNCSYPCESTWTVCPKCTLTLSEKPLDITPPVKKNDKTLGKILIAVIVIPIFLFIGVSILSFATFTSSTGSMGATFMPVDEYIAEINNPEITQWVESCGSEQKVVYALRYETEENGEKITNYAVYFPFDLFDNIRTSTESGFFKQYAKVDFGGNPNHSFVDVKYNFLLLSAKNQKSFLDLKATYNGENIPCIVVNVEYNPVSTYMK